MSITNDRSTALGTGVSFAPVVHLATHSVAGFVVSPATAGSAPSVPVVDSDTLSAIRTAGLSPDLSWLIAVEPDEMPEPCWPVQHDAGPTPLKIVADIVDRDLAAKPGVLFDFVFTARRRGWSIALDVGHNPDSIALLPLIEPDVVKVDLDYVEDRARNHVADVGYPIRAYAESTGAAVLAKGVDTERRIELAQLVGATFGQGRLLGRPGELPPSLPRPQRSLRALARGRDRVMRTPFHIVSDVRHPAMATKRVLVELSRQIEAQAAAAGPSHVCLATFQHSDHWTPRTRRRFEALGRANLFTEVFGTGMTADPLPGVRGTNLRADDPLTREWVVVVLGPYYSVALVALDLGDRAGSDGDRTFQYVITHDRALITDVARDLLRRSRDS